MKESCLDYQKVKLCVLCRDCGNILNFKKYSKNSCFLIVCRLNFLGLYGEFLVDFLGELCISLALESLAVKVVPVMQHVRPLHTCPEC